MILESLIWYYRGESRERTAKRIKERFGIAVPVRTLSAWLAEYRDLTTYRRLRQQCSALFPPTRLIRSVRLHRQQVYGYGIHRGKLAAILVSREHERFQPLERFLTEMATACPHHLFQAESRASQGKARFNLDAVEIKAKHNHACRLAGLALQTVAHNRRRHDELQLPHRSESSWALPRRRGPSSTLVS